VRERLGIVFAGMVAGDPHQGGATWAVLQYALGLRRLGHDVWLVEPVERLEPESVAYFERVAAEFGLASRAALLVAGSRQTVGVSYAELHRAARGADLLVNVAGMLTDQELVAAVPVRLYLDLDPAFTQLWYAVEGIDMRFDAHTHFATVGQAIGAPECSVPDCGRCWIATYPPVVLDRWPFADGAAGDALTTVANWRGYGSIEHGGIRYGQKAHSFRELVDLPQRTAERFAIALSIHPDERRDLDALSRNGWALVDPAANTGTPERYAEFIRSSKAELGIAKEGYAVSRCGWFSDRSVCYLASGRPVVAQDTGFGEFLPTGEGLFSFATVDDVLAAIETMNGDYARHRRAARALAEEEFDSDRVLSRLLEAVDG
jgi:hypothetical protein